MQEDLPQSRILSHREGSPSLDLRCQEIETLIAERGDVDGFSVAEQRRVLAEIVASDFGHFLIVNRGLNGYWTDYVLKHPKHGRETGLNRKGEPFTDMEDFLLNKAPTVLATQERYEIFRKELQPLVKEEVVMASVPCGLMSDLLTLDFSEVERFKLIGSDIDPESIDQAKALAYELRLEDRVTFTQGDAWELVLPEPVDVLTSNGLNIYEQDDEKVIALYRQFHKALKSEGTLVVSFLTPPPVVNPKSEWIMSKINVKHLKLQKLIFADLIQATWQTFRTSEQTTHQLEAAGFTDIRIVYDSAALFPTVVAKKR